MKHLFPLSLAAAVCVAATACSGSSASNPLAPTAMATTPAGGNADTMARPPAGGGTTPTNPTPGTTSLPAWYGLFGNGVQVSLDGASVVLRATSVPDHKSPYFGQGHAMYEAPHQGMQVNPHRIATQNITLRVPASPVASSPSDTPLGPIGVAVNGVVFFNQYAAMRMPLTNEIFSFDRYRGHPSPSNQYHYHVEPLWLTQASRSRLIGVLLDGFPVYGPLDLGGSRPADLDSCHGHVGVTAEFPQGVYHYHTADEPPYIAGCFRGAAGSVGF